MRAIRQYRSRGSFKEYRNLSTQQVFTKIYEGGVWGRSSDPSQPFFSGSGSHDDTAVSVYVQAVGDFLSTLDKKPDVVDLGCGDFAVGSKLRHLCRRYTACDIVPKLIEFNKEKYKSLNVDFGVLDLTTDELPDGDIVFIRQVLQHLSNKRILAAIPKISAKYKYLILSEPLPPTRVFDHNVDIPVGPHIRLGIQSGIVLTSPPFNLRVKSELQLCGAPEPKLGGLIITTLYRLT